MGEFSPSNDKYKTTHTPYKQPKAAFFNLEPMGKALEIGHCKRSYLQLSLVILGSALDVGDLKSTPPNRHSLASFCLVPPPPRAIHRLLDAMR